MVLQRRSAKILSTWHTEMARGTFVSLLLKGWTAKICSHFKSDPESFRASLSLKSLHCAFAQRSMCPCFAPDFLEWRTDFRTGNGTCYTFYVPIFYVPSITSISVEPHPMHWNDWITHHMARRAFCFSRIAFLHSIAYPHGIRLEHQKLEFLILYYALIPQ